MADPQPLISITMDRLPLLEALKYVALQAGMRIQIEQYAVSIVPLAYAIPTLIVAEYRVPPELLGLPPDTRVRTPEEDVSSGNSLVRSDRTSWFRSKGVDFPLGATAIYLSDQRKLVVRNTQENLDKLVSVISSALKPPAPIPANP